MESVFLDLIAVGTISLASLRSAQLDEHAKKNVELQKTFISINQSQALMFPVVSSCMLLVLFFFMGSLGVIIVTILTGSSLIAVAYTIQPITAHFFPERWFKLTVVSSAVIVLTWLLTGWHILNNILGICSCILSISFLRLPNTKIAVLLLSLLFFYDIFWVFYSVQFFGSNVMMKVATTNAANPMFFLTYIFEPPWRIPSTISIPAKLTVTDSSGHSAVLGLGDIALPGLLLSLALRTDVSRSGKLSPGPAFSVALGGYCVGLALATTAVTIFNVPQPALLYLVPCVVIPLHLSAWKFGFFSKLFHGQNSSSFEETKKCDGEDDYDYETGEMCESSL